MSVGMRRVGIKRRSSEEIGSWDLPASKRPRVEPRRGRGATLWSRISTSVGGIFSTVRRWLHRSRDDSNSCQPTMSEALNSSPPHSSSPTPSPPITPSPHTPSPPTPSPPHSPRTQSFPPVHSTISTAAHTTSAGHPPNSVTTYSVTSSHTPLTTRLTHHTFLSTRSKPASEGRLWTSSVLGKSSIVHQNHETQKSTTTASGPASLFSLSTPHFTTSLPSISTPHFTTSLPSSPPRLISPSSPPSTDAAVPENIGPRFREQLSSPSFLPSTSDLRLHSSSTVARPPTGHSAISAGRSRPHQHLPPSITHSPTLSPLPRTDIEQRKKWVESVKANHTHSLTQHRAAVELELRRLAECRESRFRAEDSRVQRLQDSVRNMSLLSDLSSHGEEEEEEEEMIALTEEQEHKVHRVLSQGPGLEVLSQRFNISIKKDDIMTLGGLNWLNDEVINFYMNLIVERGQREDPVCSVHAMSSFFYPKLCDVGYSGVRRWTKKVDIFSVDVVLYPIHLGSHWCLAVVDNNQRTLSYYDSLRMSGMSCLSTLRRYLMTEHRDKKKSELSLQGWRDVVVKDLPMQKNGSDCGVFTCMYARYLASNAPFNFTQDDMPEIRRHIICELLEQKLF